jgi:hypothetical protein
LSENFVGEGALSEKFVGEGAAKKNMCVRCGKFFSTKREAWKWAQVRQAAVYGN